MEMEDDTGWMVTRDDDLRVLYRHVRGASLTFLSIQREEGRGEWAELRGRQRSLFGDRNSFVGRFSASA